MALNYVMLSPARSPIPLPDELTIRTLDSGVELTVVVPDAPPAGGASSGGTGGSKKLKEVGRMWLTDQRVIFVSDVPAGGPSSVSFESLSVPLTAFLSTKFEQPYFGSNYLVIDIQPAAQGGLTYGTKAEVRLKDKGLFEFVSALEKTRERAIYMKRQSADDDDGLRASQVPDDAPPGYDA
ncbi:hypothetical protein B0H21DRAFT_777674 [Amylocystis lapponica]|nr:hypothetical protein B0H21DRAFT_777674 [Amylocystis lapponica]